MEPNTNMQVNVTRGALPILIAFVRIELATNVHTI